MLPEIAATQTSLWFSNTLGMIVNRNKETDYILDKHKIFFVFIVIWTHLIKKYDYMNLLLWILINAMMNNRLADAIPYAKPTDSVWLLYAELMNLKYRKVLEEL